MFGDGETTTNMKICVLDGSLGTGARAENNKKQSWEDMMTIKKESVQILHCHGILLSYRRLLDIKSFWKGCALHVEIFTHDDKKARQPNSSMGMCRPCPLPSAGPLLNWQCRQQIGHGEVRV